MKHSYNVTMRLAAILAAACPAMTAFSLPETPVELKTEVTGTRVDLTWANGDAGSTLLECGFEDQQFPPAGWSTIVTNNYAYLCSWFHYPSEDFIQTTNYRDYIHNGDSSAMMYFDMYAMKGDHEPAQDEWLMTPAVENASYLELFYYIDPTILEYGAEENFPDHYYIRASYDNGEKWTTIWDARYDAEPTLGWHNLVLPLESDAPVMIAFQGVSDTDEMVHFLWALDDVRILASRSGGEPVEGYTIKLDGKTVAEHVKSLAYTDHSPKTAGTHRYEVFAEAGGQLSPAASSEVTIEDIKLLPPVNVTIEATPDEYDETSYVITLSWDEPQNTIAPAYYNVYCDGLEVGTMLEETSLEFYGYTKGIYDFQVTAVYNDPDGQSEPVGRRIAIDTRYNAHNLKASVDNGSVTMSWEGPEEAETEVSHYELWRGDHNLTSGTTELTYTDSNVPAGKYRYYVIAVFSDGVRAIPAYVDVENGEAAPVALAFEEDFNTGFMPAGWTLENLWDNTPDLYLWQFDDPNGIGVTGEGFDKGFASIDCINSGFYSLDGTLVTPSINMDGCDKANLSLTFSYDYASTGMDSEATLEIERDNSGEWETVETLESYEPDEDGTGFSPKTVTISLGEMTGEAASIRIRWHYTGMLDYHLAIDNVRVSDTKSGVADTPADAIKVTSTQGGIFVQAADGVDNVEVYTAEGRIIRSVNAGGSASMAIPVDTDGMVIVKVTTPSGSRTVKVMM